MKTKNFSVTGTGTWAWDGPWNVLYYEDGADAAGQVARIRVQSADGSSVDFEAKPGRQLAISDQANGVIITSLTGNAITGKVSIGRGDIRDSSLLGTVQVIDGELSKSKAGVAYTGYTAVGAVAAQYPVLELWNPAASGKRVIVSDVLFSSQTAQPYVLARTAATVALASVGALSKLSGGAPSTALVGGGNLAAPGGTNLELCLVGGGVPLPRAFKQPLVVMPGAGILVKGNTVNTDMYSAMQFTEEAL